jgi:hypothetical protein
LGVGSWEFPISPSTITFKSEKGKVTGLLYQQEGRPDREAKAAGVGVSRQRPARRRSGVRKVFESFRE